MIDVIRKIEFGDTGSGDFVEVTIDSIQHKAILLGNLSTYGEKRFVIYEPDIDALINALQVLKREYL